MRPAREQAVIQALRRPRYEVIPLAGVLDRVVEHLPRDVKLTVTASPRKGIDTTLDATERLARAGYRVAPHLSARLIAGPGHLQEILARLAALRVRDVFAIAWTNCARRHPGGLEARPAGPVVAP